MGLFDEEGEVAGDDYTVYIRKTDGSPAIRVAQAARVALSPDGKWVIAEDIKARQFVLIHWRRGAEAAHERQHRTWFRKVDADGKWIVFSGSSRTRKART